MCDPITHEPDPAKPVRFTFSDDTGGFTTGVYEYYVAAYDAVSDTEGQRSVIIRVDVDAGTVNHAPVAVLTVTPDFAGAPAQVTLDASASYDLDGDPITEFRWDVDDDAADNPANLDYRSSDPAPPDESSSGAANEFTPSNPNALGLAQTLTVTFVQGRAEYYWPALVVESGGSGHGPWAESAVVARQLGISGWKLDTVYASDPAIHVDYSIPFCIMDMGEDPTTGELVAVGQVTRQFVTNSTFPPLVKGLYYGRLRNGQWDTSLIRGYSTGNWPGIDPSITVTGSSYITMGWSEDGRLMIMCGIGGGIGMNQSFSVCMAQQQTDGTWDFERCVGQTPYGEITIERMYNHAECVAPGYFVFDGTDTDPPTGEDYLSYVVIFDHEQWVLEREPLFDSTNFDGEDAALDSSGVLYLSLSTALEGLVLAKRTIPNEWTTERLDNGQLCEYGYVLRLKDFIFGLDQDKFLLAANIDELAYNSDDIRAFGDYQLLLITEEVNDKLQATLVDTCKAAALCNIVNLYKTKDCSYILFDDGVVEYNHTYFYEINPSAVVRETIMVEEYSNWEHWYNPLSACVLATNEAYVSLDAGGGVFGNYEHGQILAVRVDPRL